MRAPAGIPVVLALTSGIAVADVVALRDAGYVTADVRPVINGTPNQVFGTRLNAGVDYPAFTMQSLPASGSVIAPLGTVSGDSLGELTTSSEWQGNDLRLTLTADGASTIDSDCNTGAACSFSTAGIDIWGQIDFELTSPHDVVLSADLSGFNTSTLVPSLLGVTLRRANFGPISYEEDLPIVQTQTALSIPPVTLTLAPGAYSFSVQNAGTVNVNGDLPVQSNELIQVGQASLLILGAGAPAADIPIPLFATGLLGTLMALAGVRYRRKPGPLRRSTRPGRREDQAG